MAEGRAGTPDPAAAAEGRPGPDQRVPDPPVPGFELLEHTADIGIRARGASLEEAFGHATVGLAEVLGAWRPEGPVAGAGEAVAVEVVAGDPGGLLVDWLNEVLWLREVRGAVVAGVRVERAGDGIARGSVVLADGGPEPDGTFVKAVTYHRLRVKPDPRGGWLVEVYLDV